METSLLLNTLFLVALAMVVTGDVTQTDLPSYQDSGLVVAQKILKPVDEIAFCQLSAADVVRHPLVQKIVAAYERYESR